MIENFVLNHFVEGENFSSHDLLLRVLDEQKLITLNDSSLTTAVSSQQVVVLFYFFALLNFSVDFYTKRKSQSYA